jgi:hypothetical protein
VRSLAEPANAKQFVKQRLRMKPVTAPTVKQIVEHNQAAFDLLVELGMPQSVAAAILISAVQGVPW